MPSPSDQPDLPMSLPLTSGPLRERAARMTCRYCDNELVTADDRQRGTCAQHDDEIEQAVQGVEKKHRPRRFAR